MRVAFITPYTNACPPFYYGGEMYFWGIIKNIAEMGHEIHLFAPAGSETPLNGRLYYIPSTAEGQINYQIEIDLYSQYKDLFMSMDIIHDCSLDHFVAGRLNIFDKKWNIINTINGHTYYMPRPTPFNVVTGSKWWQKDALEHGLKTEMIYWAIDTNFYTPDYKKEDYFLWIARFHPDKGLDLALDLAKYLGFKLKIAGSTLFKDHAEYGKKYLEMIKTIPNVEYVQLPMDSTHHIVKRELYRKAKAFLFPVKYNECFGMVAMEAMACGTPVIASNKGAMPELIQDGITGFVCEKESDYVDVITKKLPDFENKKNHHSKQYNKFDLSKNAREWSLNFDWKIAAKEYEKLYIDVANGKRW